MPLRKSTIVAGVITCSAILIGALIYQISMRRIAAPTIPSSSTAPSTPASTQKTAAPTRAFAKLSSTSRTATRGKTWDLTIQSNDWSSCLVDLYQPNEKIFEQDKNAAKATPTDKRGVFVWTWHVPEDIPPGKWIARALCGTFENLAINDQILEVQ